MLHLSLFAFTKWNSSRSGFAWRVNDSTKLGDAHRVGLEVKPVTGRHAGSANLLVRLEAMELSDEFSERLFIFVTL